MGSLDFVRRLVARGAEVDARMTRRRDPIKFCAGDFGFVGATPFLLATKNRGPRADALLLVVGADPRGRRRRVTPFLAAAGVGTHNAGEDAGTESGGARGLQFMLDLGADINAVDDNGETAMHGAASRQFRWWSGSWSRRARVGGLESREQVRLDAVDGRLGRSTVQQHPGVGRHRRRHPGGAGGRHRHGRGLRRRTTPRSTGGTANLRPVSEGDYER